MPDQQFEDEHGNPVKVQKQIGFETVDGKPINLSPSGFNLPHDPLQKEATKGYLKMVPRAAAQTLPALGAMAGSEIPGMGNVLGATAGAGLMTVLRGAAPGVFGEGNILDIPINALTEGVIPSAISSVVSSPKTMAAKLIARQPFRSFPATKDAVAKTISGQLEKNIFPESVGLETMGENALGTQSDLATKLIDAKLNYPGTVQQLRGAKRYVPSPEIEEASKAEGNAFGKNDVGRKLANLAEESQLPVDVARSQTYRPLGAQVLSDLTHVRNAKLVSGADSVEQYALSQILNKGKGASGPLDADKILSELTGPKAEVYAEAISPRLRASTGELLNTLKEQENQSAIDHVVNYAKNRMIFSTAVAGAINPHAGAIMGTGFLTNQGLKRILSNPEMATLVTQALKTPLTDPKATMMAKVLSGLWRAGDIAMETPKE